MRKIPKAQICRRTSVLLLLSIVLSSALGLTSFPNRILSVNAQNETATSQPPQTNSKLDFRLLLRTLLFQQAAYVRNEILSILGDLPDTDPVFQRLLKVEQDIANATVPYYGEETAKKLGALLTDYVSLPIEGLKELRIGNGVGADQRVKDWLDTADKLATLLAESGPSHPKSEWNDLFSTQIELARQQAVDRRLSNFTGEIEAFDQFVTQSLKIADTLADSITTQFPNKFQ